ncbi:hypothetical protein NMG60_11014880 [Bertholletia excelsa]
MTKMAVSLLLLLAILTCLIVLSESIPSSRQVDTERNNQHHVLMAELEGIKFKIVRLESRLEETIRDLNAKSLYLKKSEKLTEEITHKMDVLQSTLSSLKDESSCATERIDKLEEEVRVYWATLRKSNFELHLLKSKAQEAEDKLVLVTSQVEKMAAIVTEQWIQIQHLEQALYIAEMRALKIKTQVSSTKCTFLKFVRRLFGDHFRNLMGLLDSFLFKKESVLGPFMSQAFQQLERVLSAAKKYHHELQGFIKLEMERNEFTAALANKEVVFFVASALVVFPIISAWMLISSQFS